MRREVHRELRERQGHTVPIYPKRNNNQIQYAQSPLGKVHNHPSCYHTPLNMHSLTQSYRMMKAMVPHNFKSTLKVFFSTLEIKLIHFVLFNI